MQEATRKPAALNRCRARGEGNGDEISEIALCAPDEWQTYALIFGIVLSTFAVGFACGVRWKETVKK